MIVIKRDGRTVEFNPKKIERAISKAYWGSDWTADKPAPPYARIIAEKISQLGKNLTVENIQDLVEKNLMTISPDVAKAYILYRNQRTKARDQKSRLLTALRRRLDATSVENANANVDERSFSGREKEAASDIAKIYALEDVLSEEVSNAHKKMLIYQHDLEKAAIGSHNCLNIDFKKLLSEGFGTRNGSIRPPSTLSTACQLIAVIFQCQSQTQFGGVGSVHLDFDLAPYVSKSFKKHLEHYFTDVQDFSEAQTENILKDFKDVSIDSKELTGIYGLPDAYKFAMKQLTRELRQSGEALFHNLNTLESRAGSQVPFTSINFGRDTSSEGRLVSKAMLDASISGIGEFHLTPIFPISIFQYKTGCNANPEDPNYDLKQLALESLSKRIYPNFCNCDWSQAHEDLDDVDTYFSTMGCRTMLGYDRHGKNYKRVGRGNNVPCTIILPKLGIEYGICLGKREKPDLEGFRSAFEDTLKLTEQALLERFDMMVNQSAAAAPFMYNNGTIRDGQTCKESVYNSLRHNTLAIG